MPHLNSGNLSSEENTSGEKELSLKITDYLNKTSGIGYHFKFIDDFCDISDEKNGIYIEVKIDHFAPAQILHAIVKNALNNTKMIGVADKTTLKLYVPPNFDRIIEFVKNFDPTYVFTPSQVDKPELNELADKILGEPEKVIKMEFPHSEYFFITVDNMLVIREKLDKYHIRLDYLARWLDGVGETNCINVNNSGWLLNTDKPDIFTNESPSEEQKELAEFGAHRRPKHLPIKTKDIHWFESLRISHNDLANILHEVDRLIPRKKRRESGMFWTEHEIGDKLAKEILALTTPEYVVEPCVGGGSLIKDIVPIIKGAMNDISVGHVDSCKKIFDGYDWKFTTYDVINTSIEVLIRDWGVPAGKNLLLYTNPPFVTESTNRLVSKKDELVGIQSRKQSITYPRSLEKYGKGDLFLPIVGKLIEIAKTHKNCHLAFFAPFGLFCGRKRYNKLFNALMKDFQFLKGYVFAGKNFHDINQTLPISLSVWKYVPNTNSQHLDLNFEYIEKNQEIKKLQFRQEALLKDFWRYRDGNKYVKNKTRGALGVLRCDRFNCPNPKVFGIDVKEGSGAEVSLDNIRLAPTFEISNVPHELVFGLWSTVVGKHAFGTSLSVLLHPIYFEQAYVHLPNFKKPETSEILAYAALNALLKNYADTKIGFFGSNKVFRFGDEHLTNGVEYLLKLSQNCPVYDGHTISEVYELFKHSKIDAAKCRNGLKNEVGKRLEKIGYWDYIPIPSLGDSVSTEQQNLFTII